MTESSQDLYVSINQDFYRNGKKNVLHSQADLLIMLKYLHKLRVLARRRNDLKIKLHKTSVSLQKEIETLRKHLPMPKSVKKVIAATKKKEHAKKEETDTFSNIEEELKQIQEKLASMNA